MSTDAPAPTILVIDDDTEVRYSLNRVLSSQRYRVQEAASGEEGVAAVKKQAPDVVLLDNRMTGMTGLETLQHIRAASPRQLVIFMTAYGTAQTAIEAMKYGAYDYVVKPFDPPKLLALVESALRTQADSKSASSYQPVVNSDEHKEGIVGTSPAMQEVFKAIGQFAASDASVMITGESGTGKELVARAIHRHSHRSAKAFVAVNCAAIPENLIESELFGHERGSFTGATAQRLGKFELCDGGTIFLDEIGDMTPTTQTKILRVLQEGEIQRVGGVETIKVNVRVVAATNKNLEVLVKEKKFREDLYYRLNVVRVKLPPLRKRVEDVPQIVDFFLQGLFKAKKTKVRKVSPEALALFCRYRWPGNVRELENVVYRSAVAATGDAILPRDLPDEVRQAGEQEDVALAADSSTGAPVASVAPAAPLASTADSVEELAARLLAAIAAAHPGNERAALAQLLGDKLPAPEALAPKKRAAKKH
ncbi:MAG: sigma-54-dependent Fis family transcriptional regulator [Opitutae bacterium]|nr:sigma-54-dependent Fis family transcriptional regulator [Opitutae bacterium]